LLLRALRTVVHGGQDKRRPHAKEGPKATGWWGRSALAPLWPLWQGSPAFAAAFLLIASGPALP
jgi:hypothetical protein